MGYVHDPTMARFIAPNDISKTAGTWTPGVASNLVSEARGAAAAAFTLLIPIKVEGNHKDLKGVLLKSIDVWYKIATADAADFATVELEKTTLTGSGTAPTGAAVATKCDSAHDTAAKRKAIGDHTLTVTLDLPEWVPAGACYTLQLVVTGAATTVFTLYGARVNYTLRE